MHSKRSRLVERTTRLTKRFGGGSALVRQAKALEHKGIISTYKLHDRALANRQARRRYADHAPKLDDAQQRVLADLAQHDYAVLPFTDLYDEDERVAIEGEAATFVAEAERGDARDVAKDYLIRRYGHGEALAATSPWFLACLSDRLLGLANAYLQMWSKLEYVDFWYSVPIRSDSERILSQRWHRDFDDRHLLKAFLYLVDVDADTGPLEFVSGSARGGALADFYPWYPLSPAYPSQEEFDRVVPPADVRTFTASSGTLVLCNTSGFHRGGFATGKPRVLATATYCSPASLKSLTERNYRLPKGVEGTLTQQQRYAVS
jgi:hypothetical protein